MQTQTCTSRLTGRAYYEVIEPCLEVERAIDSYLEYATSDVMPGQELRLPPQSEWGLPTNSLMNEEIEAIAGEAGYHIEADAEGGFMFYADEF